MALEQLQGRVAVVTGAGSGVGAAAARVLAQAGMRVAVADRDEATAGEVAEAIRGAGGEAHAFFVDVGEVESIRALASSTRSMLGDCSVVLANVGVNQVRRLERSSSHDWEWLFRVNVFGTAATVDAYLPQLRSPAGGQIVATASTQAVLPVPRIGVYTASKFAVMGYAETLRLELAEQGIGVTVLMPGPTITRHLQTSAAARPHDFGPADTDNEDLAVLAAATVSDAGDLVEPDHAVRHLVRAIRENWEFLVTHPPQRESVARRFERLLAAFDRAAD